METIKITTDDGKIYSYIVDQSGGTEGYSMYTSPITSPVECIPKIITKKMTKETYFMSKDLESLRFCNITEEELVGKYFDKDGYIYYTVGGKLYRFYMKIIYF